MSGSPPRRSRPWAILHWIIIANFALEIAYAGYMVFFVVTPGGAGPLLGAAATFPMEKMIVRRLYAVEAWIAITGLSLYLAVTEVAPRFWSSH